MWKYLVASALIVAFTAHCEVISPQDCPNVDNTKCQINRVIVDPCSDASEGKPCRLKRGKTASIQVDFTPQFSSNTLFSKAVWQNGLLELALPGMDSNACNTTVCPVVAGNPQNYTLSLTVSRAFPRGVFPTKLTLLGDNDDDECCLLLRIKLV